MLAKDYKKQYSECKTQHKGQILLSVVVSCKGVLKILNENLQALSNQTLSSKFWNPVFILKEIHSPCIDLIKKYFSPPKFLFLSKGKPLYEMRNLAFQEMSPLIYFIDEDVILDNPKHLDVVVKLHQQFPELTVIGGGYKDHPDCTFWGRAYNTVVRLWTKKWQYLVPAGNLSLKTTNFTARFYSPSPFGFGGEETHFLQALKNEGYKSLWKSEMDAQHLASHSLKDFITRAWFHGSSLAFEKKTDGPRHFKFFTHLLPTDYKPVQRSLKASLIFTLLIKLSAFFYLFLVRLSCYFYKFRQTIKSLQGH